MIEISFSREFEKLKTQPKEVQETIQAILQILDTEYGEDRDKYKDNGGYVLVVEKNKDFEEIKVKTYIDCNGGFIPEYVDQIECNNGKIYTNTLILCNSDYSISLIISMELTPENLKKYIIEN